MLQTLRAKSKWRMLSRKSRLLLPQIEDISARSAKVATGAQSLGATTEEMNASVELTASIHSIAQSVKSADELARRARTQADEGAKLIDHSIDAMDLISKSSEDIGEIVQIYRRNCIADQPAGFQCGYRGSGQAMKTSGFGGR